MAVWLALGCIGFPARAVPDLDLNRVYVWTPTDPDDHSYSGTITVYGLPVDSGLESLQSAGGAIVTYDIMTPGGLFTPENSTVASLATRTMSWNSEITSMNLVLEADDEVFTTSPDQAQHMLLRITDQSITLAIDPPGRWVAQAVPDGWGTLLMLLAGVVPVVFLGKRIGAVRGLS